MPTPSLAEQQGFGRPRSVVIDERTWKAVRRQLLRMVIGWRHVEREAQLILESCEHAPGCPQVTDRAAPCLAACPDRERVLSALVVLHNAQLHDLQRTNLPKRLDSEYRPPSREHYDAVVSELVTLQEGRDVLAELDAALARDGQASPWGPEAAKPSGPEPTGEIPITRLLPPEDEATSALTDDEGEEDD